MVAGIHPDRIVAGAAPDRGLVLTGTVAASRPAGAAWEADLRLPETIGLTTAPSVICRVAERPGADGSELTVTALDPPCFGPDGLAVGGCFGPVRERVLP